MTSLGAIVFDLDGTLVDSARDLQAAINILLAEEGFRGLGLAEVKAMIGDGVAKLVERAVIAVGGDLSHHPDLVARFLSFYEVSASRHTEVYPGVAETLDTLRRSGIPLAVVTNKPYAATIRILHDLGLRDHFGVVIGGDTLAERKPNPAPIRAALDRLGIAPGRAIMVGDNYHDVEAAHGAGVYAVAVTYGYSHKPHDELGADSLIGSMPELLRLAANWKTIEAPIS
ncbi:phosphoglycolate phosphatase [Microvirga pudoricolor]|uniref:phosphoglycolate phosphatase n=1 Tax=Microvirga pudoricolor TaxID=2778729 RepID=UPI00194F1980|nr:phosphoglycolate phosphatase [Microvirga pudoricolor]MBM6596393.1 phosphoglycolate phosphatase [Microvirga pudoricolor]